MSSGSRRSDTCVRCCLVVMALTLGLYVFGPSLYWKFKNGVSLKNRKNVSPSCDPCICDCPPPLSFLNIAPELANLTVTDCGRHDPELKKEMEKQFLDILAEELKLQKAVTEEQTRHMNATFLETRKLSTKYRRETEKCNVATETCEVAREQAEALLIKEKKVTSLWEQRARQLGWEGS